MDREEIGLNRKVRIVLFFIIHSHSNAFTRAAGKAFGV